MRFSYQWLREFVDINDDAQSFADRITMAGLEVDAVEPAAAEFKNIVVGEIIDIQPHPDADRLRVCQVDVAQDEPLTIVCGANNVAVGMKVPAALVGASLPGIKKLKASKLRGVKSFGMLCAATELGLSDESDGLMPLPNDASNGQCVRELLSLDDTCIEVDLTPNRGDCLSITGLAREAATLYNAPLLAHEKINSPVQSNEVLPVTLSSTQACPLYVGRIIRDIDPSCETPLWMKEKLRRSGVRSISLVVDVTNFVLLEQGQPMHAFDLALIDTGINIRHASEGETLELLDGKEVTLNTDTLVIADHSRALALAGIMGGNASSVTDSTQSIFLEAAFFSPEAMAGKARQYGLHTDSSHRFERGVDANLPVQAIERATQLLLDISGGNAGPINETTAIEHMPKREAILLRKERLDHILGHTIDTDKIVKILENLGFNVTANHDNTWQVVPAGFRFDVTIEADLIEEIARIYGYNNLPSHAQKLTIAPETLFPTKIQDLCRQKFLHRGYTEAINYSFISKALHNKFFPGQQPLALKNPISDALSVMRTSLWPGLMQSVNFNLNRQQSRIKLIEIGRQFTQNESQEIQETLVLAGIATGQRLPGQWNSQQDALDFFDIKADLEDVLSTTQITDLRFIEDTQVCLHPGQSARIISQSQPELTLGWIGKVHPSLTKQMDIPENTFVFECYVESLTSPNVFKFSALPRFPSVYRDLAFVTEEHCHADDLLSTITSYAGVQLIDLTIFDVYQGKGVQQGKKSMAIRLTFQDFSRTLMDDEINPIINKIVEKLEVKHGAKLRDA